MNDVTNPAMATLKSMCEVLSNSVKVKIPAPEITGIASKNENLAAISGFNPNISPQEIVIPLLEIPGMIANA